MRLLSGGPAEVDGCGHRLRPAAGFEFGAGSVTGRIDEMRTRRHAEPMVTPSPGRHPTAAGWPPEEISRYNTFDGPHRGTPSSVVDRARRSRTRACDHRGRLIRLVITRGTPPRVEGCRPASRGLSLELMTWPRV